MNTENPSKTSSYSCCIPRKVVLCLLALGMVASTSRAQEQILNFSGPGPSSGTAQVTPAESRIRQLSKSGTRAEFESSADWCRARLVRLNGEDYTALELPGGGTTGEIGEPELPGYEKMIQVPDGAEVRLVIDKVDWVPIEGTFNLAPRQTPPVDKAGAPPPPFARNEAAYRRDEYGPAEPVRIADRMRIRQHAVISVIYTPIVYDPAKGSLKAARRVQWHLEFNLPGQKPAAPKADATGQREFAPLLQGALDARSDSAGGLKEDAELAGGNGADYLILTHDNFYTNILPLANWKHAKGLATRVVRLSEISSTPTSTNITAYIQNAYNTWNPPPTYVLLVGDSAYLPAWYKTLHSYYGTYAATDLYYSTVDGTDYFPDLFVGRLPCTSTAQCDLMVQKILRVEKNPAPTAAMYGTILTAGEFADGDANGYEDRLFIETAEAVRDFFVANGFTVPTAYCADSTVTPRRYNNTSGSLLHTNSALYGGTQTYVTTSAGGAAIVSAINGGVWLVQHRDHGSQSGGWATPPFSPSTASALVNSNKLPVVMSINCETAWFDGASDSLAEALIKNPNGGSHCVIGATRVSYSWYNDWFTLGLYECMYPNFFETLSAIPYYKPGLTYGDNLAGHGTHVGQMLNFAKLLMYEKQGAGTITQIEFDILSLLGDPEQSPRTAVPQVLSASHPSRLLADVAASIDVAVTSGGAAVSGALVALVLDPGDYHTALTDGAGLAHFSFTPQAPSSNNLMSVTVSHQNGIPYEGLIAVDTSRVTVTAPGSTREGDGVLAGQGGVTVYPVPTNSLTVSLNSSDNSEVIVPGSVFIPLGQTNVSFDVTIVDDGDLDGTQTAVISAMATGYAEATKVVAVQDNETATLAVSVPATVAEGSGLVQGTLSVSAAPAANVAVTLTSSNTNAVQVPGIVVIAAGRTSTNFNVSVVDDIWIREPQAVTITAHVAYWTDGNAAMMVVDNEPTNLTVTLPAQAREGNGTLTNAGRLTVAGPMTTARVISLVSSDTTELTVPASVTLPASNITAYFDLYIQDDPDVDGVQSVRVIAQATGFANGTNSVLVYDDESPPVASAPWPADLSTNVVQTTGLSWLSGAMPAEFITNDVYFGTNPTPGPAQLLGSTMGTNWSLPTLAPLTTYYWQIVARKTGSTPGPVWRFTTRGVDHFAVSPVSSPQLVGTSFPVVFTAQDVYNTTVSNFTGSANVRVEGGQGEVLRVDFESGLAGFVIDNSFGSGSGLWHLSAGRGAQAGHSPSTSLYYGKGENPAGGGNYNVTNLANGGVVTSPPISLPAGTEILDLSFNYLMNVESGTNWDRAFVEVSTNGGLTYTPVAVKGLSGLTNNTYGLWVSNSVPLTQFAGSTVVLQFRFDTIDQTANTSEGWFIDDIAIRGAGVGIVSVSPTNTGSFTQGRWSGNVSVLAPATNVHLAVTDNAGHRGTSTNFDVLLANDLGVAIVARPNPVAVGGYLTNTITLVNSGPGAATGVAATNWLPASAAFVSAAASQGSCALVGSEVRCSLGTLAGGATATINVVTAPGAAGQLTNRVAVGRAEADPYAGNDSAASVTVVMVPSLSIEDASVIEGNADQTNLDFAVRLSPASPLTVTVNFATSDVTAQAGSDYSFANGWLSFSPGQTNAVISVAVLGDTNAEPVETLLVNLSGPSNATLNRAQAVGTILADDAGLFFDDFEPDIDLLQWSGLGGVAGSTVLATNYGGSVSGPNSLWFGAATNRHAASRSLNTLPGGTVDFWLRIANGVNPWETADLPGEGIVLEYSTNSGGSWVEFGRYDTNSYWVWTHVQVDIPPAAQTANTQFRWRQLAHSGTGCDHWALDNVGALIGPRPPTIVTQPASQSVRAGTNVTFQVGASGSAPLHYQWRKNGTNLVPGGRFAGTTNQTLTIASAVEGDSGQYSVSVTNANGTATSSNATLLVTALDHFAWGTISSPQAAGMPFLASIAARDYLNGPVTNFNGCLALSSTGSQTNPVGAGTTTMSFPLGTFFHDERSQVIYPPAEIGGAGRIAALSLDVATVPGQVMNFWTIRMKHTSLSSYSSYLWESSGWTTVYQTNLSVTSTGWVTFALTTPFDYNGVDSLMIDFSFNNTSYTSDGYCRSTVRSAVQTLYCRTDSGYGDPLTWSGSSPPLSTSSYTPNLRLVIGSGTAVPIQPATVCFTNGLWSGPVTVQTAASNLVLKADDGTGHAGLSNPFDVLPDFLVVTPAAGLTSSGSQGGPFNPTNKVYTLRNSSLSSLNWSAGSARSWVPILTNTSSAAVRALAVNSAQSQRFFRARTSTAGPAPALSAPRRAAGQFLFTLTGQTGATYIIEASDGLESPPWLTVSPSGGSLAAGASTNVTVLINTNAQQLGTGTHAATIAFRNLFYGAAQTRAVGLTVLPPALSVADAGVQEGDAGTTTARFAVSLTPTWQPVTVAFATSNGTAQAGSDYAPTNGVLNFAPGQTNAFIAVAVYGDTNAEPSETFFVSLGSPAGAMLSRTQAVGTILSDDVGPFFDDFEPDIDLLQWSSFGGVAGSTVLATNYGGAVSGPNSLWFGAGTDRYAVSRPLNMIQGGAVDFWLRIASGVSPWETADLPGEGIVVEYSTNSGSSWVEFGRYDTNSYWAWTHVQVDIPLAAKTTNTQFRWRQLMHSGTGCDHWALDDVGITTSSPTLHHFTWGPIGPTRLVGVPFAVSLTAQDGLGNTMTNFAGTVTLDAFVGVGVATNSILGSPVHASGSAGNFTLGYAFTPNTNLTVTHVRHYFGTKVSIWTDGGALVASQNVTSVPGAWVETPLAVPVQLSAGVRYRVAGFTAAGSYYWHTGLGSTFPNGSIDQGYETSGDAFPTSTDTTRWWFVDLRYRVGAYVEIPAEPAFTGSFVDGVWSGNVTVLEPATGVRLRADDGSNHSGISAPLDIVVPPVLAAAIAGTNLVISWPDDFAWQLECTTNLSPPVVWTPLSPPPPIVQNAGTNTVNLPTTAGRCFYRLRPE